MPKCSARFCRNQMYGNHVTCSTCWSTVPPDLRDAVALAWRKSCRWMSARWCRAVRRAVNHADRVIDLTSRGYSLAEAVRIVAEVRDTAANITGGQT